MQLRENKVATGADMQLQEPVHDQKSQDLTSGARMCLQEQNVVVQMWLHEKLLKVVSSAFFKILGFFFRFMVFQSRFTLYSICQEPTLYFSDPDRPGLMVYTLSQGIDANSWYEHGLMVWTWSYGMNMDSWYRHGLMVCTWTHGNGNTHGLILQYRYS